MRVFGIARGSVASVRGAGPRARPAPAKCGLLPSESLAAHGRTSFECLLNRPPGLRSQLTSSRRALNGIRPIAELGFLAAVAGPALFPVVGSAGAFAFSRWGWARVGRLSLLAVAYLTCLWMTSQAYHIKQAYQSLPAVHDLLAFGLGWAAVATVPSAIAIYVNKRDWSDALLTGAVISFLSLICLTPAYLAWTILLSFE